MQNQVTHIKKEEGKRATTGKSKKVEIISPPLLSLSPFVCLEEQNEMKMHLIEINGNAM